MTLPAEYALLAAGSYSDIRRGEYDEGEDTDNDAPLPAGWTELVSFRQDGSGGGITNLWTDGFSARVYRNTATNEIVISYGGTRGDLSWGMLADFLFGNVPLAIGNHSEQAAKAAELFQRVKSQHQGNNITFTGHSLGGGLASLMAVYFDRPAFVFAPAPFQDSADSTQQSPLHLLDSALEYTKSRLTQLLGSIDPALANYDPRNDFATRESNVQAWTFKGEVLEAYLGWFKWIEGSTTPLFPASAITLSSLDRHLIDFHVAGLLVPDFQTKAGLLPNTLKLMLASELYGGDILGNGQVFIADLLRNHVGIRADDGTVLRAGNGMLTHFSNDLGKLGIDTSGPNQAGQDALVAQLIEWYHFQPDNYSGQQFFAQSGNALQYTTAQGAELPGAQHRAAGYVDKWLTPIATDHGMTSFPSFGTAYQQWNVATGTGNATANAIDASKTQLFIGQGGSDAYQGGTASDLFFGGAGADLIKGGAGDDHLYGGADADTLTGGTGDDQLFGGAGTDTYSFAGSFDADTITDTGADGTISVAGLSTLDGAGAFKTSATTWQSHAGQVVYALADSGTGKTDLVIAVASAGATGRIVVRDWAEGRMGISLGATPIPQVIERTYTGDYLKQQDNGLYVIDPVTQNIASAGAQANAQDWLVGSQGDDKIQGLGGNDYLVGYEGDDLVQGGDGADLLYGGYGRDALEGGAGNDFIWGSGLGRPWIQEMTPVPGNLPGTPIASGFTWAITSSTLWNVLTGNLARSVGNVCSGVGGTPPVELALVQRARVAPAANAFRQCAA